ncbi:RNA polymerase sigma factor [Paratissierella segnis]|uniref:RNA polymerase sigma factor n=1 Tax=Paratissierella segnis TaxID=2763679 RepID=A0A926EUK2_9FIRM|nr:RNA polymerase sigma factor [Paratissierella segnis]MBC8586852.1 RNA polymerase sigma factor [Paratissierella segnis]
MEDKLKLLKEGNQQAFEEFVIEYRKEAVNFAANILKDYHIAEDIVQDSFAFIYVYRERIREYSTLKSYLFSIIHNRAIDYIRKNNRNITIDLDAISTFSPEEQILDKERRKSFIKSFNSLNEKYKVVLYLYGFQELSYKEISEVVGISLAQVKINIFRGRKKLKTLYNEEIDQ